MKYEFQLGKEPKHLCLEIWRGSSINPPHKCLLYKGHPLPHASKIAELTANGYKYIKESDTSWFVWCKDIKYLPIRLSNGEWDIKSPNIPINIVMQLNPDLIDMRKNGIKWSIKHLGHIEFTMDQSNLKYFFKQRTKERQ